MISNIRSLFLSITFFSLFLLVSCHSSDDTDITPPEVNIEEAKLSDFPLFGVDVTEINIIDPEIINNKETKFGEIKIIVPARTSLDEIATSITSQELDLSKFSIAPGNDELLSFENEKVHVFTISAIATNTDILHYEVSIVKEEVLVPETLRITSFTFEKSKNPNLPDDVTISKTVEASGLDKIYLFVPSGTDFTDLIPTVAFDGTKLYYSQESSSPGPGIEYPAEDTSFDFKYPKVFNLTVEDRNGDKRKTTAVIVDVINPVKLEAISVTTPDVTQGTSPYFTGITKWTNQGNHIINFQKATTYEDVSPVITPAPSEWPITVDRSLPGGGLKPGESANVNVQVSQYYPEGIYKSTAVFYTRIFQDNDSDDLFEPAKLQITANIVSDDDW